MKLSRQRRETFTTALNIVPGLRRPLDHVGDVAFIPELEPAVVVAVEGVPLSDAVVVDPPLVGHRDPDHSRRDQERPGECSTVPF